MSTESKKVWVVGHKNPDTDSIMRRDFLCISEKPERGQEDLWQKRAGAVNEETRYVLERFGVEERRL